MIRSQHGPLEREAIFCALPPTVQRRRSARHAAPLNMITSPAPPCSGRRTTRIKNFLETPEGTPDESAASAYGAGIEAAAVDRSRGLSEMEPGERRPVVGRRATSCVGPWSGGVRSTIVRRESPGLTSAAGGQHSIAPLRPAPRCIGRAVTTNHGRRGRSPAVPIGPGREGRFPEKETQVPTTTTITTITITSCSCGSCCRISPCFHRPTGVTDHEEPGWPLEPSVAGQAWVLGTPPQLGDTQAFVRRDGEGLRPRPGRASVGPVVANIRGRRGAPGGIRSPLLPSRHCCGTLGPRPVTAKGGGEIPSTVTCTGRLLRVGRPCPCLDPRGASPSSWAMGKAVWRRSPRARSSREGLARAAIARAPGAREGHARSCGTLVAWVRFVIAHRSVRFASLRFSCSGFCSVPSAAAGRRGRGGKGGRASTSRHPRGKILVHIRKADLDIWPRDGAGPGQLGAGRIP